MSQSFYITGGTLPADAPCYIERQADRDLPEALLRGEFCYILDTRQVGKSSLLARSAVRLRAQGVHVAQIDLTNTGQAVTPPQWYIGLLRQIADSLESAEKVCLWEDFRAFWRQNEELGPLQRWIETLRQVALARLDGSLVIFVDEIEQVRGLDFTDEFFAGIRACYNRRVEAPEMNRLTFCLAGSATPNELIRDVVSTPFNIGVRIQLTDFTLEEAKPLADGLNHGEHGGPGEKLLQRVLYWTNGHPYLTQHLCRALAEMSPHTPTSNADTTNLAPLSLAGRGAGGEGRTSDVDHCCADLFFTSAARETEKNLTFVGRRLLDGAPDRAATLDKYAQMRRRGVRYDEKDALCNVLLLSGVARAEEGVLRVRNRLYARVFDTQWIRENMPDAELKRQRAAAWRAGLRIGAVAFTVVLAMGLLALRAMQAESKANQETRNARKAATERQKALVLAQQAEAKATKSAKAEAQSAQKEKAAATLANREKQNAQTAQVAATAAANRANLAATRERKQKQEAQHQTRLARAEKERADRYLYIANMNLAQAAWENTPIQVGRVLELLQATRNARDRGFEWGYWNRLCHLDLLTFQGHTDSVRSVAFSPDGKRVVTGSGDNTAKVWDAGTGRETLTLKGHTDSVRSVAFSPDGKRVVTGSRDNTVKVWIADFARR